VWLEIWYFQRLSFWNSTNKIEKIARLHTRAILRKIRTFKDVARRTFITLNSFLIPTGSVWEPHGSLRIWKSEKLKKNRFNLSTGCWAGSLKFWEKTSEKKRQKITSPLDVEIHVEKSVNKKWMINWNILKL
jgi:hypothetical protein